MLLLFMSWNVIKPKKIIQLSKQIWMLLSVILLSCEEFCKLLMWRIAHWHIVIEREKERIPFTVCFADALFIFDSIVFKENMFELGQAVDYCDMIGTHWSLVGALVNSWWSPCCQIGWTITIPRRYLTCVCPYIYIHIYCMLFFPQHHVSFLQGNRFCHTDDGEKSKHGRSRANRNQQTVLLGQPANCKCLHSRGASKRNCMTPSTINKKVIGNKGRDTISRH